MGSKKRYQDWIMYAGNEVTTTNGKTAQIITGIEKSNTGTIRNQLACSELKLRANHSQQ